MVPLLFSFNSDFLFTMVTQSVRVFNVQQGLELRGLEIRGFRRYTVFNWVQKTSLYTVCFIETLIFKFFFMNLSYAFFSAQYKVLLPC